MIPLSTNIGEYQLGCFSFLCKESDKAVLSDSFSGDKVRLYLLVDGKIVEEMRGEYDSYGCVFTPDRSDSLKWTYADWNRIVDLMCNDNPKDGIAAILEDEFRGKLPTTCSEDDPNQGWGEPEEEEEEGYWNNW